MRLRALPAVPLVSVLVTAYNVERFIAAAIDSALAVDWPADRLEIVVIDDGSTDRTLEILKGYGDRITLLAQPNQGCVAAMNACLAAASGDVIAFLDGDDECPRDKLRRQVKLLQKQRQVGLVYGDVEIIDANGEALMPSFLEFGNYSPLRGRILGQLLPNNFVITGSIVVRADLRELFWPIPPSVHSYDWYVASRVAEAWELDYVSKSVGRYRFHGENMTLGQSGEKGYANNLNDVVYARMMLTSFDLSTVSTGELVNGLLVALSRLNGVAAFRGVPGASLLGIEDEARVASSSKVADTWASIRGKNQDQALRLAVQAIAFDPANQEAALLFDGLFNRVMRNSTQVSDALPSRTRTVAVRADAAEMAANPEMLSRWAAEFTDADDVTLVLIVEPDKHDELAVALLALAARVGLDHDNAPDIALHACANPDQVRYHYAASYSRGGTAQAGAQIYDETKMATLRDSLAVSLALAA